MPIKVHDIVPKFVSEKRNNEKPIYASLYYPDPNISVKDPEEFLAAYSQSQTPINQGENTNILKAFYGGNKDHTKDKYYLSARGEEGSFNLPGKDTTSGDGSGSESGKGSSDKNIDTDDKSETIEPASSKKDFYKMHHIDSVYSGLLSNQTKVDNIHGGLAYLNVTNGGKSRKKITRTRKIKRKSRKRKNKKRKKNNTKRRKFRKFIK